MAAPVVASKGTANFSTGTSVTPSYPASIAANDIVFLLAISHQPTSIGGIDTPSGFTEAAQGTYQNSSAANQGRAALFWKRAAGGESGTVTVTRTGDTGADSTFGAQMYRVTGCIAAGNPWDAVTARYGPGNATITWDAVTVSGSERTLLAFCVQADDSPGASTPTNYTRTVAIDTSTTGTDCQLSLDDRQNQSSDGSVTAGNGETIGWATFHVSAKPQTVTTVTVPAGALTLTGFTPTVQTPVSVAVPAGALTLTGFAPTVSVGGPVSITVPAGALTLTGFAPAALINTIVNVPAGNLTLTGFAPTVVNPRVVNVPAGALVLTGFAPTVIIAPVGGGGRNMLLFGVG